MTQTYNENVVIDGNLDEAQLTIQGVGNAGSEQSSSLQSWQTADAMEQARITGDGRLQIGSFSGGTMSTDDSLIEAHRSETDTNKPKRGFHLLGAITDPLSSVISWIVQELVLKGTSGISALHTALRVRLTNENTGDMTSAELLGGDIEVSNDGGHGGANGKVPSATGLRVGMLNQTNGYLETGHGVEIEMANSGSADTLVGLEIGDVNTGTDNYAIRTGLGKVKLGSVATGLLKSVNGEVKNIDADSDSDVVMVGASDTENGSNGLVPQPVAGDEEMYLRGDGTWADPPGTGGGITITQDNYIADESSHYVTSSTSFVDVDSTNLALTIETSGNPVLVHFHGYGVAQACWDFTIDGTRHGGDDGVVRTERISGVGQITVFTRLLTNLAAGSHTFKLQWKKIGQYNPRLYNGDGDTKLDVHPQFWVMEIS